MKVSQLRAGAALALALALAGCGGKATFDVNVVISGLTNTGLVLANGSDTLPVPSGTTNIAFGRRLDYGQTYLVTVQAQPAHMTCTAPTTGDSAGHTTTISVPVVCVQNSYKLSGNIYGLKSGSLVLADGSNVGTVQVNAPTDGTGATSFTFGTSIPVGTTYGVTVLTQPDGLFCSVTNDTGVMADANVSNVQVSCAAK